MTDKLNLKRPREGSRFRWHQDSPYWAHVCGHLDRLPNVMVTLDDADASNGCFRLIRGSHRRGMLPGCEGEGVLGPLFTHPDHFDDRRPRWPPRRRRAASSSSARTPCTAREPNRSERPRRALIAHLPARRATPMFKVPRVRETRAALDASISRRRVLEGRAQLVVVARHRELRELATTFSGGRKRMPASASASMVVSL